MKCLPWDAQDGVCTRSTEWEKTWRKRNSEWEYKVRFVGREYRWQEFWEDLFAPGASYCTGRIVDILSLKRRAFHQASELEDVAVEPPEQYLDRLWASGMCVTVLTFLFLRHYRQATSGSYTHPSLFTSTVHAYILHLFVEPESFTLSTLHECSIHIW